MIPDSILPWAYLLVLSVYVLTIALRPSILMRPSVFVTVAMMFVINIAAAFIEHPNFTEYADLSTLRTTTILFPIPILLWVCASPFLNTSAERIYRSCRSTEAAQPEHKYVMKARNILVVAATVSILFFLAVMPLQNTGLYAILFNQENSMMARENTLKSFGPSWFTYSYTVFRAVIAPALAILICMQIRRRHPVRTLAQVIAVILLLICVSLEGSRLPVGIVLLSIGVAYLLKIRFIKGAAITAVAFLTLLTIAGSLTFMREHGRLSSEKVNFSRYTDAVVNRAFIVPFETGVRTLAYTDETGLPGVRSNRLLAELNGYQHVNLPRNVYQETFPGITRTGSINTCFLFDLQASYGIWWGWLIALPLLMVLDLLMLTFKVARGRVLIAFYATFLVSTLYLISSAYATALVTGGILISIAMMYCTTQIAGTRILRSHHSTPILASTPVAETRQ